MTRAPSVPVRRSPLEGVVVHGRPAAASVAPLTLSEVAPLDKVVARGIGSPETAGRIVHEGAVAIWNLDADEALVGSRPGEAAAATRAVAGARTTVDVSSGFAALRLAGPAARALLEEVCPVDLSADAVPDRAIVQAAVANVRVILGRTDVRDQPAFTLLVARDEARYLWDALTDVGEPHGLVHAEAGS